MKGVKVESFFATLGLETDAASFAAGLKELEKIRAKMREKARAAVTVGITGGGKVSGAGIGKEAATHARATTAQYHNLSRAIRNTLWWVGGLAGALALVKTVSPIKLTDEFAKNALAAENASKRIGVNVQTLQQLGYAASETGIKSQQLYAAMGQLSYQAGLASRGEMGATKAFWMMGLSIRKANGELKTADELLLDVSAASKKFKDPQYAAFARKLMGSTGTTEGVGILPLLRKGPEEIRRLMEEARRSGALFSSEDIEKAKKYREETVRFQSAIQSVKNIVGREGIVYALRLLPKATEWVKEHREAWGRVIHESFEKAAAAIEWLASRYDLGRVALSALIAAGLMLAGTGAAVLATWSPLLLTFGLITLAVEDVYGYLEGDKSFTGTIFFHINEALKSMEVYLDRVKTKIQEFRKYLSTGVVKYIPGASYLNAVFGSVESSVGAAKSGSQLARSALRGDLINDLVDYRVNPSNERERNAGFGDLLPSEQRMKREAQTKALMSSGGIRPTVNITNNNKIEITTTPDAKGIDEAADRIPGKMGEFWESENVLGGLYPTTSGGVP